MPRYDDYDRHDDEDDHDDLDIGRPRGNLARGPMPQSGVGFASIAIAILVFLGYFVSFTLLLVAELGNAPVQDDDPVAIVCTLGIVACLCLNVAGLVLGFVGCFQSGRHPMCAILGTVFNGILFLSVIALVIIGILAGA